MRGLAKLEKMKGQTYLYMAKHEKILYSMPDDERKQVIVVTDKRPHIIAYDKLDKYLTDFMGPITEPNLPEASHNQSGLPQRPTPVQYSFVVDRDTIVDLKTTLLDNIKKVKESKDYLAQSFEINQNVKTLILLGKTELELAMIANKET